MRQSIGPHHVALLCILANYIRQPQRSADRMASGSKRTPILHLTCGRVTNSLSLGRIVGSQTNDSPDFPDSSSVPTAVTLFGKLPRILNNPSTRSGTVSLVQESPANAAVSYNADCATLRDKAGAILSRIPSDGADCVTLDCTRRAIVLPIHGTIVIMKACKLFSKRRVATTACAVLPALGIVG